MAAAMAVPCVTISSGREMPGRWHPYGERHLVLRRNTDCHTCYRDVCPHDNLCMRRVEVPDVLRATELLIAASDDSTNREPTH